ncbi:MAG TPA: hypothetical protein VE756_02100, partial [Burkholderiales bacterium]|nr:hypothetical protein [Burkholderiales bacterium]
MGSRKDVVRGLGDALGLPVICHSAAPLERLSADKTSLSIYTADEIDGIAASCSDPGAMHLLREIAHVVCVRAFRAANDAHDGARATSPIAPTRARN